MASSKAASRMNVRRPSTLSKLQPALSSTGCHVYKAFGLEVEYTGPSIKKPTSRPSSSTAAAAAASSSAPIPTFIGPDGTLYDSLYHKISNYETPSGLTSTGGGSGTDDPSAAATVLPFIANAPVYSGLPRADAFDSFEAYDAALVQWKAEFCKRLGTANLPTLLGSVYYRPREGIADITSEAESSETEKTDVEVPSSPKTAVSASDDVTDRDPDSSDSKKKVRVRTGELSSEATEGDMDDSDLFDKKWTMEKDPWSTRSIPAEPVPEMYATFEEYQYAVRHWAYRCTKVPVIPMHPLQLKSFLTIKTKEERLADSKLRESALANASHMEELIVGTEVAEPRWTVRSGLLFLANQTERPQFPTPDASPDLGYYAGSNPVTLPQPVYESLGETFTSLASSRRSLATGRYKQYAPSYKGTVRGVLKHEKLRKTAHPLPGQVCISDSSPLLRPELTNDWFLRLSNDPGVPLEHIKPLIPSFDLDCVGMVSLVDPSFRTQVRNLLIQIETAHQSDSLYSWFYPKDQERVIARTRLEMQAIISSPSFSVPDFLNLIRNDMYLDTFIAWLNEKHPSGVTNLNKIDKTFVVDAMPTFLALVENVRSELHVTKWAYLLMELIVAFDREDFVPAVVSGNDILLLYRFTKCFVIYSGITVDLHPYNPDDIALLFLGRSEMFQKRVNAIFQRYYLSLICEAIDNMVLNDSKFFAQRAGGVCATSMMRLAALVGQDFIEELFTIMNGRSVLLTNFALFMFLQLLHSQPGVVKTLQTESVNMIARLNALAGSKKLHAQTAARVIYRAMMQNDGWVKYFCSHYNEHGDIVTDLNARSGTHRSPLSFLLEETILDLLKSINAIADPQPTALEQYAFLMRGGQDAVVHKLLDTILPDSAIKKPATAALSKIAAGTIKVLVRRGWLLGGEGPVRPPVEAHQVAVSGHDLLLLMDFIARVADTSEAGHQTKTCMLRTLRYLTKSPLPFDSIKKEKNFYSNLLILCRDGANPAANQQAWKMVYQLVKFHAGVIPYLEANHKLLNQLLETISISAPLCVIRNSLHYISLLLGLADEEATAVLNGVPNSRGELESKSVEKDVKTINSLIVKGSKWIKIHMIYKKLSQAGGAGEGFIALANLYRVVHEQRNNKSSGGQRLYEEIKKNEEYLAGVEEVVKMFNRPQKSAPTRTLSISRVSAVIKKE